MANIKNRERMKIAFIHTLTLEVDKFLLLQFIPRARKNLDFVCFKQYLLNMML